MPGKSPFAPLEHMRDNCDSRCLSMDEIDAILKARDAMMEALTELISCIIPIGAESHGPYASVTRKPLAALAIAKGEFPDA